MATTTQATAEDTVQTILTVDDDPQIRRLIDRALRAEGYTTRTCISAESALVALREGGRYSLVLLDVMMGGETGFELARRIRNGEAGDDNRALPIVFVTAENDGDSYEQSFDVGAHRYITKPFAADALVEVVQSMLHE